MSIRKNRIYSKNFPKKNSQKSKKITDCTKNNTKIPNSGNLEEQEWHFPRLF